MLGSANAAVSDSQCSLAETCQPHCVAALMLRTLRCTS